MRLQGVKKNKKKHAALFRPSLLFIEIRRKVFLFFNSPYLFICNIAWTKTGSFSSVSEPLLKTTVSAGAFMEEEPREPGGVWGVVGERKLVGVGCGVGGGGVDARERRGERRGESADGERGICPGLRPLNVETSASFRKREHRDVCSGFVWQKGQWAQGEEEGLCKRTLTYKQTNKLTYQPKPIAN